MTVKGRAMVIKSNKRYALGKKLFDEIAKHFPSNDIFTSFVEVMRAVIVTCTSGDTEAGFVRIKKYITVDARFRKPKTCVPTLLPTVSVKLGRPKKNNRGKMARELHGTPRQCTFCLSRNPVHRVGTKCQPLMAKGMNVELSAQSFALISTTQHAPATNLIPSAGTRKPCMDTSCSTSEGNHDDIAYICTLYVHATDCIGTFIVPTTTLAD